MTTIKATIQDGRLELKAPADWPDGTEVEIHPIALVTNGEADGMSPDEIAQTLAAMDQYEPVEMTDAELTAWETEQETRKNREKTEFMEHAEKLRRNWE